ncbi:MATE family efflux transporter DinF [Vibrio sp. S4M6]|nr:MATE family efflux transporter DinF [Vibrio sinus]
MISNIFTTLSNKQIHKQVLLLAIPMVLSNITVPLLGLVDSAVIGHLKHAWYLGGVSLGSTMISVTFWLLGFLRMSTTGLTAQSWGAQDKHQLALTLLQGLLMAVGLAVVFLILHAWISELIFSFSSASAQVKQYGAQYFSIRAWGAPAALANFVLLGWLLGTQDSKSPMWMVIIANVTNILLDFLFVVGFEWKVQGVAIASVIAEYVSFSFGLLCVTNTWRRQLMPSPRLLISNAMTGISRFVKLNRDIFLRSLFLQAALSFMVFKGASYGDDIVAANAVLMSFVMIISYGMDGFAYAMEAMVGKAIGGKNKDQLADSMIGITFWSLLICLALTLVFVFFGSELISLITSIVRVQQVAAVYLPWLMAMPLVSMWCFLLDGIFIGATKGKQMRNSMFLAMCGYFIVYWLAAPLQNHALWLALLSFMALRGLTLAKILFTQWRANTFLAHA